MPMSADLGAVEDQTFILSDFRLQDGTIMGEAMTLTADGKNAMLIAIPAIRQSVRNTRNRRPFRAGF